MNQKILETWAFYVDFKVFKHTLRRKIAKNPTMNSKDATSNEGIKLHAKVMHATNRSMLIKKANPDPRLLVK